MYDYDMVVINSGPSGRSAGRSGCTLGEGATELIHIGQAVLNHGTIDYFIQNTFNYPTLAEAYKMAGLDAWNRMSR
jgi:pyruvate/2-oxoglutarate dehydrogenase complex dihydrolipoamide dehydrogenase (E3) component